MISSCPCWLCFHLLSCSNCNPWHHRFSFLTSLCIFLFRFLEWGGWCWTMLPFGSATRIIPFSALQWPSDFVWDWSSDSHRSELSLLIFSIFPVPSMYCVGILEEFHLGKHEAFWTRLKAPQVCEKSWSLHWGPALLRMHRLSLLVLYYTPHFPTFRGREFLLYQKFPCDN